jgi:outer membrane protein TolC
MKTLLLTILLPLQVHAVSLTWDQYLNYAIEGNPALEAAKQDWRATQQNEDVAFAAFLPSLRASTSWTRAGSSVAGGGNAGGIVQNGVIINSGSAGSAINDSYVASLIFSQNLFASFKDKSKIEQAEWRTKNSFWNYVDVKSQVSYSLKEAFSNLVYAQESLSLSQSILDRRESNYRLVKVRFENGRENKGSVLLAEAYRGQAELDVIKAKDGLQVAQSRLKTLMNRDHLDDITVEGEVPLMSLNDLKGDYQDQAIQTPTYNKAHALEMASTGDISVAQSAFLPSLDLTGNVTRQGTDYFPQNERWNAAVTLTIPLFDGLRDKALLTSAVKAKYSLSAQKKNALLELLPKLRDAQNQAKQGDIKYTIDKKFQDAASTRAEIARAKYNNGLITFEDWDIIESELITRQTNFLASKRDRIIKYAAWENQLGKGSIQ